MQLSCQNGCQKSVEFLRIRLLMIEPHILCEIRLLKRDFFFIWYIRLKIFQLCSGPSVFRVTIYSFIKEVCANEANLKTRILNL